MTRAGKKNRGFFTFFLGFLTYNIAGHKMTHKQKFDNVNAKKRNSYLNIICIKLVTQVRKKTKIHTFT